MFPNVDDPFWIEILKQKPKANSLALRLIIDRLSRDIAVNKISEDDAVGEIRDFFNKYKSMCKSELEALMGQLN